MTFLTRLFYDRPNIGRITFLSEFLVYFNYSYHHNSDIVHIYTLTPHILPVQYLDK